MFNRLYFYLVLLITIIPAVSLAQTNPNGWGNLAFDKKEAAKLKKIHLTEIEKGIFLDSILKTERLTDRCGKEIITSTLAENTQNLFFGETIYVRWVLSAKLPPALIPTSYQISITNLDGKELYKKVAKEAVFNMKIQPEWLKNEEKLFIVVLNLLDKNGKEIENYDCDGWACRKIEAESAKKIQLALDLIEAEAKGLDLSTKNYLKARFFAKQQLNIDAIVHFQQAIDLAKGTRQKNIRKLFQIFLSKL